MPKNTPPNQQQLTKLACDAYAFIEVAQLAERHISSIGAQPMSTAHVSLKTVMMVNAGLAIELTLKLIHHKLQTPVPSKELYSHSLVHLFGLLDKSSRDELERRYASVMKSWAGDGTKNVMTARIMSATTPDKPTDASWSKFGDMLEYLDEVTLFLRRYSFEAYSLNEWWIEVDATFLQMIYKTLADYTADI